jgi:hypothetical protein
MGSEEPKRNGYNRLDDIQEPEDRTGRARTYAWVSVRDLANCMKLSPWKAHNLRSALEVLRNPSRVFKHIRANEEESGWCYSSQLESIFDREGRPTLARANTVYVVYMNRDFSVFEWGPEPADRDDPQSPEGAHRGLGTSEGRFGELAWERQ